MTVFTRFTGLDVLYAVQIRVLLLTVQQKHKLNTLLVSSFAWSNSTFECPLKLIDPTPGWMNRINITRWLKSHERHSKGKIDLLDPYVVNWYILCCNIDYIGTIDVFLLHKFSSCKHHHTEGTHPITYFKPNPILGIQTKELARTTTAFLLSKDFCRQRNSCVSNSFGVQFQNKFKTNREKENTVENSKTFLRNNMTL